VQLEESLVKMDKALQHALAQVQLYQEIIADMRSEEELPNSKAVHSRRRIGTAQLYHGDDLVDLMQKRDAEEAGKAEKIKIRKEKTKSKEAEAKKAKPGLRPRKNKVTLVEEVSAHSYEVRESCGGEEWDGGQGGYCGEVTGGVVRVDEDAFLRLVTPPRAVTLSITLTYMI